MAAGKGAVRLDFAVEFFELLHQQRKELFFARENAAAEEGSVEAFGELDSGDELRVARDQEDGVEPVDVGNHQRRED